MALTTTKLQEVLAGLLSRLGDKAEDAYLVRDAAYEVGDLHSAVHAAGRAHAFAEAAEAVREAQAEADR